MQKLKTRKGVAKRFKLTKKGKIAYNGCNKSHLATNKENSRLRGLRKKKILANSNMVKYVKRLLPYG